MDIHEAMDASEDRIKDIYESLETYKKRHNIEHTPLFVRCSVALFEAWHTNYLKSLRSSSVQPPRQPPSRSRSPEPPRWYDNYAPTSRGNSRERHQLPPRPHTSRGRNSQERTSHPPHRSSRSRSHSAGSHSSQYSVWSRGPDSSQGSRSASRHPSDQRHTRLSELLLQLKML